MPKIEKLPSGKYSTRINMNGTRTRITADTYAEVKARSIELLSSNKKPSNEITLGECIDQYIKMQEPVLSPTSIRSYIVIRKNYFKSIMDCQIDSIASKSLQDAINHEASVVSPKTIANALGVVSASLKTYGIQLPRYNVPQKKKTSIRIPTKAEVDRLIEGADGDLKVAVILGAYLGLRRGEICALTPQDFNGDVLTINKDLVLNRKGEWVIKPPKTTDSERRLVVPNNIKDKIVLPIKTNPNYITELFENLCKRLNIDIRFHDLRHYFVSVMVANNIPNLYIRSYTGHHSDNMINKTYSHLMENKQREIAKAMPNFFDGHEMDTRKIEMA